ncbi:MAG: Flp pilus assembly complex ATPase component TadA [Planctomycetes bacterium]|nr:Flp pilus assembly complex ATPase component TadA [Planctomycetota bacterium]
MTFEVINDNPLILRLLEEHDMLSPAQKAELTRTRRRFLNTAEEALVGAGILDEETVARLHAEHLSVQRVTLEERDGKDIVVEVRPDGARRDIGPIEWVVDTVRDLAERIGEPTCRKNLLMPVAVRGDKAVLACINPSHFKGIEEARMRAGCVVSATAAPVSLVHELSRQVFGSRDAVAEIARENTSDVVEEESDSVNVVDLQRSIPVSKESQVLRYVNQMLARAIDDGASDIHVEGYESGVRIRFRVDGRLLEIPAPPRGVFQAIVSRLKILAKMDIAEKRIPQDGAISVRHLDKRVDLRVNTVPTVYSEKVCIRLLEKESIPDDLTPLGFTPKQAEDFIQAANSHNGLMFVTGPTGSGKSTTLYTCLKMINNPEDNIVTVEDPVEYRFHGLNQVHVKSSVGLDFASALRAFLRQDPDKIMVGEVRDTETAQICMRAALTGHLVLSTLHTNSALQVVNRLVDMGVEPFLLGPALRLVEAQRLGRRLCPDCKEGYRLPGDVAARYGLEGEIEIFRAVTGSSCERCRGTGCKGRVGLYEVIPVGSTLSDLIAKGADQSELKRAARAEGQLFLEDDIRRKVTAGVIGLEEVAEYIRVES